jgi:hypothetical protein
MTLAFVTVCEAEADFRTASGLADRVLCEAAEWVSEDVLDAYRRWRGLDDAHPYLLWTQAARLAREAGFRVHGHFDGAPGQPDAQAARRALWLIETRKDQLDGVLLIRDDDRQTARRRGLEQAREETSLICPIVIGLAHLKRECWALVGFEPTTADEHARLSGMKQELSFDPRIEPERLTAKGHEDERSAKRVLRVLTNDDPEREADCWHTVPLALLRTRGQATGLAEYLEDVRRQLAPLFTGHAPE